MKYVWANAPNRDGPAQPMKGNQLLMEREQLLMKGDQALSLNWLCLGGQRYSSHLPGKQFPCLPSSWNMWPYQCTLLQKLHPGTIGQRTWWTPQFEWGSDPQAILGECLLQPGAGYPHAGIMQFLQTLVGVMVMEGWCPVLDPLPEMGLLANLPSVW